MTAHAAEREADLGQPVAPIARWLLPVVGAVPVAVFGVLAGLRLGFGYDLQWLEGSAVEISRRVADGSPLYTSPTPDYVPWPYPPLYFWVTGGLSWLIGPGYLPLRLVSVASTAGAIVLIGVIVTRRTAVATAGVVAAGTYAAAYQLSGDWADTSRVDSLLLVLLLGGLLIGRRATTPAMGLLSGALLAAAVLTKQNALLVAVPLVGVLWLRARRAGGAAAAALVAVVVGVSWWQQVGSDGWYGEFVVKQLLGHGIVADRLWGFWLQDLALPLVGLLVVAAWWAVQWRRCGGALPGVRSAATDPELVACAGLLLMGWVGRVHLGGYLNVLMPACVAAAILTGLAVAGLWRGGALSGSGGAGVLAGVLALQLGLLTFPWSTLVPSRADREAGDRFVAAVAATPGRVVVLGHPHYGVLAGQPVTAHVAGITDVLDGGSGRARDALTASLATALDGVDVVVLDDVADGRVLQPALDRDFALTGRTAVTGDGLFPVTDLERRPTLVYVRRGAPDTEGGLR